jgi:hypothetical protein
MIIHHEEKNNSLDFFIGVADYYNQTNGWALNERVNGIASIKPIEE